MTDIAALSSAYSRYASRQFQARPELQAGIVQLAAAPALLGSDELPSYKVVSRYPAGEKSGLPGVVVRVHSKHIHPERPDQAGVDKMLSAGMRVLTGAKTGKDAWASFFSSSDVVGIKVNCSGAPAICASPRVVGGIVQNLLSVGVKADNIYIYERFLDQLSSVHYERFVPEGAEALRPNLSRLSLVQ